MKNFENLMLALLVAGTVSACSSTRTGTGSGGTDGTSGTGSGTTTDSVTTTDTTTNGMSSNTSASVTSDSVTTDGTSNANTYSTNTNNSVNANASDSVDINNTTSASLSSDTSQLSNNASMGAGSNTYGATGSGNVSTNYSGSAASINYLMNGYQGPLNNLTFSNYTSPQTFIPIATESGTREVELSRIAQQKAESPEVKAFAAMMIEDHTKNNQQLMSVASDKNVDVSNAIAAAGTNYNRTSSMGAGNTTANIEATDSSNTMGVTGSMTGNVSATDSVNTTMSDSVNVNANTTGAMGAGNTTGTLNATGSANVTGVDSATTSLNTNNYNSGNVNMNNAVSSNNSTAIGTANDLTSLNNLTGNAFDVQYMRMMLQDHQQAIALFTSASESSDPEVRAFALKTLPALKAHFEHARGVNNRAHMQ
ncbi:MAG: DUF4142 domain-containing protein [Sphingobacteriaceae bacterium]